MLDLLIKYDIELFLALNKFGTPEWDSTIYFLSNNLFFIWGLLFLIPLLVCYRKFKKHYLSLFFFAALAVGISDYISSSILKPTIKRPRPCREVSIKKEVYIPFNQETCSGKYGFTSSHASNAFAIAMFFYLILRKYSKKWFGLFLFASMISVTRIYLAKHYPLDLLCGALIGLIVAYISYRLWHKFTFWQQSRTQ